LQYVSAAGHAHAPELHVWPAPHARPHAPQLFVSFCVLAQPFLHAVSPPVHEHTPLMHGCPAPQALPHVPQLSGSESRCAQ
jgi:hypothetical protein